MNSWLAIASKFAMHMPGCKRWIHSAIQIKSFRAENVGVDLNGAAGSDDRRMNHGCVSQQIAVRQGFSILSAPSQRCSLLLLEELYSCVRSISDPGFNDQTRHATRMFTFSWLDALVSYKACNLMFVKPWERYHSYWDHHASKLKSDFAKAYSLRAARFACSGIEG